MVPTELDKVNNSLAKIDFEADANAGLENARGADFQIPFFQIIQSNSPQVTQGDGKYLENAKAGQFLNTVTNELFDGKKGLIVIPCFFSAEIIEWKPRNQGGGIAGRHPVSSDILTKARRNEKKVLVTEGGNELRDTANHAVLVVKEDGSFSWGFISMTSTQRKKSKKWNTLIREHKLPSGASYPSYGQVYKLTTVPEKNSEGNWLGWSVEFVDFVPSKELYDAGKAFHMAVKQSGISSAPPDEADTADAADIDDAKEPF